MSVYIDQVVDDFDVDTLERMEMEVESLWIVTFRLINHQVNSRCQTIDHWKHVEDEFDSDDI
jgi:hypothetical protein